MGWWWWWFGFVGAGSCCPLGVRTKSMKKGLGRGGVAHEMLAVLYEMKSHDDFI